VDLGSNGEMRSVMAGFLRRVSHGLRGLTGMNGAGRMHARNRAGIIVGGMVKKAMQVEAKEGL
jgi:hypothetical protein